MRKAKKILFISLVLVVLLCLGFLKFTKVSKVSCTSQFGPCSVKVEKFLSRVVSENLFTARSIAMSYLAREPLISDFSVSLESVSVLRIFIIERYGYIAFKRNGSENYMIVDIEGVVIKDEKESALPVLSVDEDLPPTGQSVKGEQLFGAKLLKTLSDAYGVSRGYLDKDSLKVEVANETKVIFPLSGDKDVMLGSLRFLLSRLKPLQSGSTIDLRYKNPVIRSNLK